MPNVELKRGQEVKEDAFEIRRRVFMEEQGYTDEFDDIDDTCIHIVLYKDGEPAGCARTFPEPAGSTRWAVGRVAVLPEKREGGFGRMLVEECERAAIEAGGDRNMPACPSSTRELVWPHGIHALRRSRLRRRRPAAHLDGKDYLAPLAATPHIETIRMASGFLAWLRSRQTNALIETARISGGLP